MSTQARREIEFRGEPILDKVLARPVGSPVPPPARSNGSAAAKTAPASAPAPAPRGDGAVTAPSPTPRPAGMTPSTSAREKAPSRPGSADRSDDVGARPAPERKQAYLDAIAALAAAKMAVADLEQALPQLHAAVAQRRREVAAAVEALGSDPLGVLAAPAPRQGPLRRPGQRAQEIMPFLPGSAGQIARAHGGIRAENVRKALIDLEKRGLVRRRLVEPLKAGRRGVPATIVWERVDGGAPS